MSSHSDDSNHAADYLTGSDNSSVHSDGTELDAPSSDTDDSNPPGTPIETRQHADVMIQSPGRSFTEKDSVRMLRRGDSRAPLGYANPAEAHKLQTRGGIPYELPRPFLEWLSATVESEQEFRGVCPHLETIRRLQFEWEQVGRDGFLTAVSTWAEMAPCLLVNILCYPVGYLWD